MKRILWCAKKRQKGWDLSNRTNHIQTLSGTEGLLLKSLRLLKKGEKQNKKRRANNSMKTRLLSLVLLAGLSALVFADDVKPDREAVKIWR